MQSVPAPQLPSLEMQFNYGADKFLEKVMGQHYIVSYGDKMGLIREFCRIKGIELI